ncbi:MAG: conjugal transfer protein TraX, partial [Bacilli bacterium]|nr:conjugal transfer protein TraX [Bacilli bacterium]
MENNRSIRVFNGFWLKIIAVIAMTFDHIAVIASSYGLTGTVYDSFRVIGRLALPLFAFLIVEGVINTKSFLKYIIRLLIVLVSISIGIIFLTNIPSLGYTDARYFGNIFIDLTLGAVCIYCLRLKGFKKLLGLLPVIYVGLSFFASYYEATNGVIIHWFPYFLRTQFGLMGFTYILIFYLAHILKDVYLDVFSKQSGMEVSNLKGTTIERNALNIISALLLLVVVVSFHFLNEYLTFSYLPIQIYALLSGAFILLYNGTRGYNSKWFQYGVYIYYPLHLIVIALVY